MQLRLRTLSLAILTFSLGTSALASPLASMISYFYKTSPCLRTQVRTYKSMKQVSPEIEKIHKLACEQKDNFYRDPISNLNVLTEYFHLKRGSCCGQGCRHCPYDWENVKDKEP